MKTRLFVASSILVVVATVVGSAKEWNGIIPLHSARSDVERILGPFTEPKKEWASFHDTGKEGVLIMYASGPPCGSASVNMWNVPRGTVVSITVRSKAVIMFSDLKLDESKYVKSDDGEVPGYTYYRNAEEGESLEVYEGRVTGITYFPSAQDDALRCSKPTSK